MIAFIGFGEAAQAFAGDAGWRATVRAFDIKTDDPELRTAKLADYAACNAAGAVTATEAVAGVEAVLSLVTADQAGGAAQSIFEGLPEGALFCDMNSVAAQTKQANAQIIEAAGGRYVDVAVMSPVYPKRLATPLLVSGPHADDAEGLLTSIGFTQISQAGPDVGRASNIKMIRSILIKGVEAVCAECMIAADKAGVLDDVVAAIGPDWAQKADYNLDRMMIHGQRRAAEMEEVVKTLEALGIPALMTSGTVLAQQAIGEMGLKSPADTLAGKIEQINHQGRQTKS